MSAMQQDGAGAPTKIKLRHGDTLIVNTLVGTVQLNALRRFLAEGFQIHLQQNPLLHQIFNFQPREERAERLTALEKKLYRCVLSACAPRHMSIVAAKGHTPVAWLPILPDIITCMSVMSVSLLSWALNVKCLHVACAACEATALGYSIPYWGGSVRLISSVCVKGARLLQRHCGSCWSGAVASLSGLLHDMLHAQHKVGEMPSSCYLP